MVAKGNSQFIGTPPLGFLLDKIGALKGRNVLSPASRALLVQGDVIPGLRSSRYIGTRSPGLLSSAAPRLVGAKLRVESLIDVSSSACTHNKALQPTR